MFFILFFFFLFVVLLPFPGGSARLLPPLGDAVGGECRARVSSPGEPEVTALCHRLPSVPPPRPGDTATAPGIIPGIGSSRCGFILEFADGQRKS